MLRRWSNCSTLIASPCLFHSYFFLTNAPPPSLQINYIILGLCEEGRDPRSVRWRPGCRMWSRREALPGCETQQTPTAESYVIHSRYHGYSERPLMPPPPILKQTIHNLRVGDIEMKRQRAVFMPSSHLGCVFISSASIKEQSVTSGV